MKPGPGPGVCVRGVCVRFLHMRVSIKPGKDVIVYVGRKVWGGGVEVEVIALAGFWFLR